MKRRSLGFLSLAVLLFLSMVPITQGALSGPHYLQVEDSHSYSNYLVYNAISSRYETSGYIFDTMVGSVERNGSRDGIVSLYGLNGALYIGSRVWASNWGGDDVFTDVSYNRMVTGYSTSNNKTVGVIVRYDILGNFLGDLSFTVTNTNSVKPQGIAYSRYHNTNIVVGWIEGAGFPSMGFLMLGNESAIDQYARVLSMDSAFLSVDVVNNQSSTYYGYIYISGVVKPAGQADYDAAVLVVAPNLSIAGFATMDMGGNDIAMDIEAVPNGLVVGGYYTDTATNTTRGFIREMTHSLSSNWQFLIAPPGLGYHTQVRGVDALNNGTIAFAGGYISPNGTTTALLGILNSNWTPAVMYMYGQENTLLNDVDIDGYTMVRAVGKIMGQPFPSQLVVKTNDLYTSNNPLVTQQTGILKLFQTRPFDVHGANVSIQPTIDNPSPTSGLFIVLAPITGGGTGNETTTTPPTSTTITTLPGGTGTFTTTTATTTLTTITNTGTYTRPSRNCIDISTGTHGVGMLDALGTLENPVTESPDWGTSSPYGLNIASVSLSAWPQFTGIPGYPGQWVTAYYDVMNPRCASGTSGLRKLANHNIRNQCFPTDGRRPTNGVDCRQ